VLRGAGLAELWPQMLVLLAITAVTLFIAALRFNKRVD
jgi:ABC-type transport system involved in multi-copper enzyme maturation permease subunit